MNKQNGIRIGARKIAVNILFNILIFYVNAVFKDNFVLELGGNDGGGDRAGWS